MCVCVCPYWFSVFWSGGDHWRGLSLIFVLVLGHGCYGRRLRHSLGALCGREGANEARHYGHFLHRPTRCCATSSCVSSRDAVLSVHLLSLSCRRLIIAVYVWGRVCRLVSRILHSLSLWDSLTQMLAFVIIDLKCDKKSSDFSKSNTESID